MKIRKYARLPPNLWHDNELKQFGLTTTLVSIYLRSSPHSNMIYLYQQQPEYAAVDIGLPVNEYLEAIGNLQSIGFCAYDSKTNYVWLRTAMIEDVGEELKETDLRVKGIQALLKGMPESHFLAEFKREFKAKYKLNYKGASKGASKQVVSSKLNTSCYSAPSPIAANAESGELVSFSEYYSKNEFSGGAK